MKGILIKIIPILMLQMVYAGNVKAENGPPASLLQITNSESPELYQIFLDFSRLPAYRLEPAGKSINLVFENTITAPTFKKLTQDKTVRQFQQNTDKTTTSLAVVLNQEPRQVESSFSVRAAASAESNMTETSPMMRLTLKLFLDQAAETSGAETPLPVEQAPDDLAGEKKTSRITIEKATIIPEKIVEPAEKAVAEESIAEEALVELPVIEETPVKGPAAMPPEKPIDNVEIMTDQMPASMQPVMLADKTSKPIMVSKSIMEKRAISSPYEDNWEKFFSDYEVPVTIAVPLQYSLPPFPCLELLPGGTDPRPLAPAVTQGKYGNWDQALVHIRTLQNTPDLKKRIRDSISLLDGDILVRQERYAEAIAVLAEFKNSLYAQYLKIYALAASGNPYDAEYELSQLDTIPAMHPMKPYYVLLSAEISLVTEQFEKALDTLTVGDTPAPAGVKDLLDLRRADALHALGNYPSSSRTYQMLQKNNFYIKNHPYSLARLADTVYRLQDYQAALLHYTDLGLKLAGRPGQDLAFFAAAMCRLKLDGDKQIAMLLKNIITTFPGTEGEYRARLKTNDLVVLSERAVKEKEGLETAMEYGEIAEKAPLRELREEAAFKQILALYMKGERLRSGQYLQAFLRDYASGSLRPHAEALQVYLLPTTINESIKTKDYMQALVLAEQNRDLLISGRINGNFLAELGLAFAGLAFWSRAIRVYRYMLDVAKGTPAEEAVYLPLIDALYNKEDYELIGEYAEQYLRHYAAGKDSSRIFYLHVSALQRNGLVKEAAALIKAGNYPESRELNILAGHIFWEQKDYAAVEKHLARTMDNQDLSKADPEDVLLRAEALFLRGMGRKALPLYRNLLARNAFFDQATYRSAQIRLTAKDTTQGLKLLRNLAEKGNSPLWRRMATETLAMETM